MIRVPVVAALVVVLIGCGGGESVSPPPPPSPPPSGPKPASALEVRGGDGQQGVPATALPGIPTVFVKDVDGRAVAGAVVTFAIDSGNGQVANPTATSDANGLASGGAWTLGPTEGSNVLVASLAGAAAVKLRATARYVDVALTDTIIPATGGTIAYRKAGDPLDGLTVTIPKNAYGGNQSWQVVSKRGLKVTLPAGLTQIGSGFSVGNNQGYSDSVLAIRVPVRVGPDTAVAAFMYDPATRYLEMIPIAARDANSLTVATTHVGSRFLWQPGTAAVRTLGSSASRAGFDPVDIVVVALPASELAAGAESGFLPGRDDWEFTNNGSYLSPLGSCLGMSVTAMYYYDRVKLGGGKNLFRGYDLVPGYDWDNPQGLRYAGMVQYRYERESTGAAVEDGVVALSATTGTPLDVMMYQSLVVAMRATNRPQLFTMDKGPHTEGHAVVAYAVAGGRVKLADPNQPGSPGVTATFTAGTFLPVVLRPRASAAANSYTRILVLGSSSYLPTSIIESEWQQFKLGQAGNGTFPSMIFEAYNPLTDDYERLGDSVSVWADEVLLTMSCAVCQPVRILPVVIDRQARRVASPIQTADLTGRDSLGMLATINDAFVDFKWALIKANRFGMKMTNPVAPTLPEPKKPLSFTALPHGKAPPGARYVWDFGDQTAPVTRPDDSTVTHTFADDGIYEVKVIVQDASGAQFARASMTYEVGFVPTIWRFTKFTLDKLEVPGGQTPSTGTAYADAGGVKNSDHVTWFRSDSALFKQLATNPERGLLILVPREVTITGTKYPRGVYLQSDPTGVATKFDPSKTLIPLARDEVAPSPEPDYDESFGGGDEGFLGSSITQTRDFTGLPAVVVAPQRVRVLVAWRVDGVRTDPTVTGDIERWQSLWVYLPASSAKGMYWYNKIHHKISYTATRVQPSH